MTTRISHLATAVAVIAAAAGCATPPGRPAAIAVPTGVPATLQPATGQEP